MSSPMHGKTIATVTYYEGDIINTKNEIEQSLYSTKENLLKDIIDALLVLNSKESNKLDLEICIDNKGRYRIIKKWVV